MICRANQLTGFYIMATLAFNELSNTNSHHKQQKQVKHNILEPQWRQLIKGLFSFSQLFNSLITLTHFIPIHPFSTP